MRYPTDLLAVIILVLLALLAWLIYLLLQKRKKGKDGSTWKVPVVPGRQQRMPRYDPNEDAIIFLDKNTSLDDFKKALTNRFDFLAGRIEIYHPCPCSDAIIRVKGLTVDVIGQPDESQNGTGGGGTPPGINGSGAFGGALYCPNYYFDLPFRYNAATVGFRYDTPPVTPSGEQILVAILDTGLDPLVAKQYEPSVASPCAKQGEKGYNFIDNNSDTTDDFGGEDSCSASAKGHGTPVTGLVLQMAAGKVDIKILPVKCLDKNGHATLIEVMCALAYAKNAGAKIINLSLGFYSPLSEAADLFKKFLEDYITKDNTLVVVAAGNCNSEEDKLAMAAPQNIAEANLRNLDEHLFFPAAFSEANPNVISVTTVSSQANFDSAADTCTVCPRQNYSTSKVQIGVAADTDDFRFYDAFVPNNNATQLNTWLGSSFATPVVSGLLAANYNQFLKEKGTYDRDRYFDWLKEHAKEIFREKTSMSLSQNDNNAKLPDWLLVRGKQKHLIATSKSITTKDTTKY